jgi:hypothetical protein
MNTDDPSRTTVVSSIALGAWSSPGSVELETFVAGIEIEMSGLIQGSTVIAAR